MRDKLINEIANNKEINENHINLEGYEDEEIIDEEHLKDKLKEQSIENCEKYAQYYSEKIINELTKKILKKPERHI